MSRDMQISVVRSFSQTDFDCFARLSGDNNPIHADADFSAKSRFGRPVAHGLLLCSVLRGLVETLFPGCHLVDQSVMFPAPTFAGESIRFTVAVSNTDHSGTSVSLEALRETDGTVTCQGTARVMP